MPSQRSAGQVMIGCWCDKNLTELIDAARARKGMSRSQFCRVALVDELRRLGIAVPEGLDAAPDRTGKGGPKTGKYPERPAGGYELNDNPAFTEKAKESAGGIANEVADNPAEAQADADAVKRGPGGRSRKRGGGGGSRRPTALEE